MRDSDTSLDSHVVLFAVGDHFVAAVVVGLAASVAVAVRHVAGAAHHNAACAARDYFVLESVQQKVKLYLM